MSKNSYNIEYKNIDNNLNNLETGKYHYNYNGIDFMFNNKQNSKALLIVFHFFVYPNMELPVFYKHDYESENVSILSISDKSLEKYKNLMACMYYGEPGTNHEQYYYEIIEHIIKKYDYKPNNTIFYGSCSGGHPAIIYGSLFKSIILMANPFIYQEGTSQFEKWKKQINVKDPEKIIIDNRPIKIYIISNICDSMTRNFVLRYKKSCNELQENLVECIDHDYQIKYKLPHNAFYPKDKTFDDILQEIIQKHN